MSAPERVAQVFAEVADTLVEDFDVVEFLDMVTSRASELVGSMPVGLLLEASGGGLQLMAVTDERTEMLELFQLQAHEGPCLDCFTTGGPVAHPDLAHAQDSWPVFGPRAAALGFRSVHAFPLRLRGQVLGALNLFSDEVGQMAAQDVTVVQALADVATIGLLQERAIREGETLSAQLQGALTSRIAVEQAKGALAQLHDITPEEAFTRLRTFARNHGLRLSEVSRAVVSNPGAVAQLTTP